MSWLTSFVMKLNSRLLFWGTLVLMAIAVMFGVRMSGRSAERSKRMVETSKAVRRKYETEQNVRGLSDDDLDRRLHKHYRD